MFLSRLISRELLSKNGGDKCVYLVKLSVDESSVSYEHGDIALVRPRNDISAVNEIIGAYGFSNDDIVELNDGRQAKLFDALLNEYDLSSTKVTECNDNTTAGNLKIFETPTQLVSSLKSLRPRAYSIASSSKVSKSSIDLIVALASYVDANGSVKNGLTSGFLCKRANIGESINVSIKSSHFKLPQNNDDPLIMIGPGAGLAPFKGFLEERMAVNAKGKNWLFFGDRHRDNDFILEEQLNNYVKAGFLTLDLAFSRDQAQKIYVQNKILENAKNFWEWICAGAYIYVCGDAKNMAKDVEAAILQTIETYGNLTSDEAKLFLSQMKKSGKYQKDVY